MNSLRIARTALRASRAAAAPPLRLLQRLGAAAPFLALALALAGPRLCCWCRLPLRAGGEARDLHG